MKTFLFTIALLCLTTLAHATLSATVSWNPVQEPDLAGYRIYRSLTTCAAFVQGAALVSVGKVTTYVDSTIPDATTTVAYKVTAVDAASKESPLSSCAEKTFATLPPPVIDPTPPYDDAALWAAINLLKARMQEVEGDVGLLEEQRDRMKAGLCALKGSSLTKDVVAERAALGGCP